MKKSERKPIPYSTIVAVINGDPVAIEKVLNYYKGLIRLRKEHPAFRMTTAEDIARHLVFDNVNQPNVVSYTLKDNANGDSFKEIKVIFNGGSEDYIALLPRGEWKVIARDGVIDPDGI